MSLLEVLRNEIQKLYKGASSLEFSIGTEYQERR